MQTMGFHLMESPDILAPEKRSYEEEDYPERDGVKVYPYTVDKAFEYTVKLLYFGELETMNSAIRSLWNSFFEPTNNGDVKKALPVTIYNLYKGVKIVGYPTKMPGSETIVQVMQGAFIFELTLYVAEPNKCNFNYQDMAKYGKNNYFDGVVLPEPKEEALRRMAKGVNTTRGYLYARSIDIDKYNGDRSFQVAFTTGDDITTTQYIRNNYPLGLVISNDSMYVSMWGQWLLGYDVQSNTEYDVVVSFDVTTRASTLYVNGQLIATRLREDVAPNYSKTYFLGAYPEQTNLFTGDIALCREFNFQIPKAVVALLHNNGDPAGYILPQNLKNIKDMAFTSKTFEFDMDSPYYQRVLESGELESGRKYRVDYVVEEWDIAPAVIGTCGISCGVLSTVGTQYWPNISAAKLGENQYVVVDTKETGDPYMFVYASNPSDTYTSRRLKVTVHSVKMLGCVAEYLPQNLIPTAEGSVVKWLDSAPQLPEANGILPPLDASVGGYDLAAIGNPKIII